MNNEEAQSMLSVVPVVPEPEEPRKLPSIREYRGTKHPGSKKGKKPIRLFPKKRSVSKMSNHDRVITARAKMQHISVEEYKRLYCN